MCGKLAFYGRYYDNRNPTMGKLPNYNIVKNNSFTVTNSNFRTFRAQKIKGGKSDFFHFETLTRPLCPQDVFL